MNLTDALRTLCIDEIGGVGMDIGETGAAIYRLPRVLTAAREYSRHSTGTATEARQVLGQINGVDPQQPRGAMTTVSSNHELVPEALHDDLYLIAVPVFDMEGRLKRAFYRFQTRAVPREAPDELSMQVSPPEVLRLEGLEGRCYYSAEHRTLYMEQPDDPYARAVADCGLINSYIQSVQLAGGREPDRDWESPDGGVEDWLDRQATDLDYGAGGVLSIQEFAERSANPPNNGQPFLVGLQGDGGLWLQFRPGPETAHEYYRPAIIVNDGTSGVVEGLAAQFIARGHPVVACGAGRYEHNPLPHCSEQSDSGVTRTDIASIDWALNRHDNHEPVALVVRSETVEVFHQLDTGLLSRPNVLFLGAVDAQYSELYRTFLRTRNRPPLVALCSQGHDEYEYTAETRTGEGIDLIVTGHDPLYAPALDREAF